MRCGVWTSGDRGDTWISFKVIEQLDSFEEVRIWLGMLMKTLPPGNSARAQIGPNTSIQLKYFSLSATDDSPLYHPATDLLTS